MPGLLDFLQSPQTAMAAGLLTPTQNSRFGPSLMQGLQAGMAQQQGLQQSKVLAAQLQGGLLKNRILENQLNAPPAPPIGDVNPSNFTPESVAAFQESGNYRDLVAVPKAPLVTNTFAPGGFKVPTGFKPNPNAGQPNEPDVIPITGGPVGRATTEAAAKKALIETALNLMPTIRKGVMEGPGNPNRTLIASMNANLPFSEGRIVRTQILDAIEAKLRAESGAAVPQTEVQRAAERFMPSTLDKAAGVEDKMDRLEAFLRNALKNTDPELFERLTAEKEVKKKGPISQTKTLPDGRTFMKKNGQWFEVTK